MVCLWWWWWWRVGRGWHGGGGGSGGTAVGGSDVVVVVTPVAAIVVVVGMVVVEVTAVLPGHLVTEGRWSTFWTSTGENDTCFPLTVTTSGASSSGSLLVWYRNSPTQFKFNSRSSVAKSDHRSLSSDSFTNEGRTTLSCCREMFLSGYRVMVGSVSSGSSSHGDGDGVATAVAVGDSGGGGDGCDGGSSGGVMAVTVVV
ncbi:uncharacterized protein LOC133302870 [Gastrolobium bilobum]|uniref:uncharacterized protein LOC133302870 n=1 Tax=Gastrolobium bilobum TaxID=150636 RepID=UPI002AB26D52|nr:uncharacterized protein LOC133302870 [Gastrolobium bilobum]